MKFNFDFENIKKIDRDAIKAFEKKYRVEIPNHLMALIDELNGAYLGDTEVGNSVNPNAGELYGVHGFVNFSEVEGEAIYIDAPTQEYLPFAFDECGNYFLLKLATDEVYFWDHEFEYPENMRLIANSLDVFIQSIRPYENDENDENDEMPVKTKSTRSWIDPEFKKKMIKLGIMKDDKE